MKKSWAAMLDTTQALFENLLDAVKARLLLVLLSLPLLVAVLYSFFRGSAPISPVEVRLFCSVFLLATLTGNFAFLRLYNALVQNSAFLLALKKELLRFENKMERFTTSFAKSVMTLKTSLGQNEDKVSALTKVMDLLNRILRKEK